MTAASLTMLLGFSTLLAAPEAEKVEAEKPAGFDSIRVHQTGGFAGFDIVYEIGGDGKWVKISKRPRAEKITGTMDEKALKALKDAASSVDWSKIGKKLINPNVADDFRYEIRVKSGEETHMVDCDGTSAAKVEGLKGILMAINKLQAAAR